MDRNVYSCLGGCALGNGDVESPVADDSGDLFPLEAGNGGLFLCEGRGDHAEEDEKE